MAKKAKPAVGTSSKSKKGKQGTRKASQSQATPEKKSGGKKPLGGPPAGMETR